MDKILAVGKVIKMPCMRSGICAYPNEKILVTKEALERLAPTMQGVPVVIEHPEEKITDQTIAQLWVVGRVADMHYDQEQEIWYAHFVVDNAEAVELLQSGYGVSTAWIADKYAAGGTFNNVPYDKELIEGRYEHLAIVKFPRYEMAFNPVFQNSKDGQNNDKEVIINNVIQKRSVSMLGKIWKKVTQREEVMVNSGEEYVVEIDGKETPLAEVVESIKTNEVDFKEKKINGDEEIDVDDEKMTVNQLVEAYKNLKKSSMKKNEEPEKEEEEEKKESKKNEDDEKEEKEEDKKTNSRFDELENLHENGIQQDEMQFLSLAERVQMGKDRYGSKK
jgi:hypothetical protein